MDVISSDGYEADGIMRKVPPKSTLPGLVSLCNGGNLSCHGNFHSLVFIYEILPSVGTLGVIWLVISAFAGLAGLRSPTSTS